MPRDAALDQAIQLLLMPSAARMLQETPLPVDIVFLLRILAREPEAEAVAVARTGKSVERIREAAEFYADQVLFSANVSAYRALAAEPGASRAALRAHMSLLLRWLHPDLGVHEKRTGYFDRVIVAWDILQSPSRRAEYDRKLLAQVSPRTTRPVGRPPMRSPFFATAPTASKSDRRARHSRLRVFFRRLLRTAYVGAAAFVIWLAWAQPPWLERILDINWLFGEVGAIAQPAPILFAHAGVAAVVVEGPHKQG
jgi:hypothetical protein